VVDIARVRCASDRVTPWVRESCEVLERRTVGWVSRSMELVGTVPQRRTPSRARAKPPGRHALGASNGVALGTIQHWMGHADAKTTQVYARCQPSGAEAEVVDAAFG